MKKYLLNLLVIAIAVPNNLLAELQKSMTTALKADTETRKRKAKQIYTSILKMKILLTSSI